jgi:hypothetical protein
MQWNTARDTGELYMWGDIAGHIIMVNTDAGTPVVAWKPLQGNAFWCHGFTFGGSSAPGGPYSLDGDAVPTVLRDDRWRRVCPADAQGGIAVFSRGGHVLHSGFITKVNPGNGAFDPATSLLLSKEGMDPMALKPFQGYVAPYGDYETFVK